MIPKYKIYGGERYFRHEGYALRKSQAKRIAKKIRKREFNVRIERYYDHYYWYIRKKRR